MTSIGHEGFATRVPSSRIITLDLMRTAALAAMVVFHTARDLELMGQIPAGTTLGGGWAFFARLVAESFLFLAGTSLYLAHGQRIRWRAFFKRLLRIAAAAGLVTAVTYAAMPDRFVYFGILHSICAASLIGLLFLRAPVPVTLVAAAVVFILPDLYRFEALNSPALAWIGLSQQTPASLDFEPVFPWLAPFLIGVSAGKFLSDRGSWNRLRNRPAGSWTNLAAWPGRHSLLVYLVHQPVLLAVIWLATAQ
ncbi:DUF1624 domain-containing protein [Ruegeria sediminis]|uniref:DUF1624 domain-containing protein n=2 Tax=Ruegeria sediminis TaxID=2583820 RepID=A0ABY2WTZ2_9RHOB|nr:DUF1624 domain-containing protein [Ruegeria sediminis]